LRWAEGRLWEAPLECELPELFPLGAWAAGGAECVDGAEGLAELPPAEGGAWREVLGDRVGGALEEP
jgi:hypothetical protein